MSPGKDKAFLILSKLGDQRDHIISLMKPEISAIFITSEHSLMIPLLFGNLTDT